MSKSIGNEYQWYRNAVLYINTADNSVFLVKLELAGAGQVASQRAPELNLTCRSMMMSESVSTIEYDGSTMNSTVPPLSIAGNRYAY